MGQGKNRRDALFAAQQHCIFCGGVKVATTVEHCPPRAMFQNREWPEGFEFAACAECNNGSSDEDLLIAMLARCGLDDKGAADGRLEGLIKMVHRQYPSLIKEMLPGAVEARRLNRELGIIPGQGQTQKEVAPVKVTEEMHSAVQVFAAKLTKGIFFKEAGRVFPADGRLGLNWFTNADLVRNGNYPVFQLLAEIQGVAPTLVRNKQFLNDQFSYKYSAVADVSMFLLQVAFGTAFGFLVVGAEQPGRLESMFADLAAKTGRSGPFALI